MEVRFTSSAIKELKRIGPGRDAILAKIEQYAAYRPAGWSDDADTILAKIEQYAADPTSLANNVKALRGSDQFRLRVGDHRVLFTVEEDGTLTVMLVEAIRHRREAYD